MTREEAMKFKFPFGKHEGETLGVIYLEDKSYLVWAFNNLSQMEHPELFEALEHFVDE